MTFPTGRDREVATKVQREPTRRTAENAVARYREEITAGIVSKISDARIKILYKIHGCGPGEDDVKQILEELLNSI